MASHWKGSIPEVSRGGVGRVQLARSARAEVGLAGGRTGGCAGGIDTQGGLWRRWRLLTREAGRGHVHGLGDGWPYSRHRGA
eukprot:112059-Chlamydomonas_euryale.AAC.3